MNELMIVFKQGGYIYYKTRATNSMDALKIFTTTLEMINVNIDNLKILLAVLRDKNGFDIDTYVCE